jgi:hypothetical protein
MIDPNALDVHSLISGGSILVNLFLTFVTLKVKLELSEIKIWILENFEKRKEPR